MKKHIISVLVLLTLVMAPLFAQLDLKEKAQLVGVQLESKPGAVKDETATDISFIFIDRPTAYYHNLKDSVLTIEFYDAVISDQELTPIKEAPFSNSIITKEKVNVNKDIEGLQAEYKDIVRVVLTLQPEVKIDYTMTDDYNVVTFTSFWTKSGKLKTTVTGSKSRTWMWVVGGVVGVSGGVVAYLLTRPTDDGGEDPKADWDPTPPALPTAP